MEIEMTERREMLKRSSALASLMLTAGVWPGVSLAQANAYASAAFEAKNMADLSKALGMQAPVASKDIVIQAADIAENGAVVPVGASTTLPGVKRLMILIEKNPSILTAIFDFTDSVETSISTRAKMGQSSNVFAVALMNDGRALFAVKEVKVTLGGCGG
jgi:sulfur-oxidizing protein SoxY